jgi:hypothetical protein
MGELDHLKYEVKLFELENGRWNYIVYVSTRAGERWSQSQRVGQGVSDTEESAVEEAQEKATTDRQERDARASTQKMVALK